MATERVGIHSFAELEASIGNAKTAADVKTAYESNLNTNAFTDAEQSKLSGVESGAEVNPTDAEIKTAYENNANTNAFTDAEQTKLAGIATGAEVNAVDSVNTQTGAVVLDADDISDATTTNKFTNASDISKLAGIEAGAEVNAVDSVFGRTGAVTAQSGDYTKSDVGLANVDNTSDADKPISTATQTALDAKQGDITLTTTGTSGAATLIGDTLNIPQYSGGGGSGTVTEVTTNAPLAVTNGTTTPDLSISQSTTSTDGYLSSTDWNTFNDKQNSITLTTTGTSGAATLVGDTLNIPQYSAGGGGIAAVVDDTTPQLGGDLDLNTHDVTGTGNINITGTVTSDEFIGDVNGAIRFNAKNESGATLLKGKVVSISGVSGNETLVDLADADDATARPAFGLVYADANNNAACEVITFGNLTGLNTSAFTEGDTLYVSTSAGELTATAPSGESADIQNIGRVIRSHASAGIIKVGGAGRANATPNLDSGKMFLGNASNQSVSVAMSGDVTIDNTGVTTVGTINSVAVATVTSGAALGATANQDSTATILAGDLTGTVNSVPVATVTSGAALGATANQDSTATILSGDLTGTVNSVAVATVTSGAALGATSVQPNDNVSTLTNDADYLPSDPTGVTGADVITNIMSLTQAEYDAIATPDASTLYIIA